VIHAVAVACGGLGTRLGYRGQKCLVTVADRPFLHWKLDQLVSGGADEFHLLVSHGAVDVLDAVGSMWEGRPVIYHYDEGVGPWEAANQASESMPFAHWFTYGDVLVDYPLRESMFPYMVVTKNHPTEAANTPHGLDAGFYHRWGKSRLFIPKFIESRTWQANTLESLEECRGHLVGLG
jgi:molybdopterin-guanine dinucleotide biosynthesis protein A